MYNGRKRIHTLKFQSVTAPNGLTAHLFGPVEGRRHDAYILHESRLLPELEARSHDLKVPFPGNNLGENQPAFNASMSKVHISGEWAFGEIVNLFKFRDFQKTQKVLLSACAKMYIVSGLLTNDHSCLYKNNTLSYFGLDLPTLNEYFQNM